MPDPNTALPWQNLALTGTLDSSGKMQQVADLINKINQGAQQSANLGRIPGEAGLESLSSGNIANALTGTVPADVLRQLGQQAAERGAMTGSPLGPGSNADYLRSLGLTSLNLMGTGQDWLSKAVARNPAAPIYDISQQTLTPAQTGQLSLQEQALAQQLQIAQMEDATRRFAAMMGARAPSGVGGGGGGTPISKAASNWTPTFAPTPAAGGTATITGTSTSNQDAQDAALWDFLFAGGPNPYGESLYDLGPTETGEPYYTDTSAQLGLQPDIPFYEQTQPYYTETMPWLYGDTGTASTGFDNLISQYPDDYGGFIDTGLYNGY